MMKEEKNDPSILKERKALPVVIIPNELTSNLNFEYWH